MAISAMDYLKHKMFEMLTIKCKKSQKVIFFKKKKKKIKSSLLLSVPIYDMLSFNLSVDNGLIYVHIYNFFLKQN